MADSEESKYDILKKIENDIIKRFLSGTIEFVKNAPPLPIKKPDEKNLRAYYKTQLMKFPKLIQDNVGLNISETDWNISLNFLDYLIAKPQLIVRNRDTGFGNLLASLPQGQSVEEFVEELEKEKSANQLKRIIDSVWDIDQQYRYGHFLEDLCQALVFYESRFLLSSDKKTTALDKSKTIIESFSDLRNWYADRLYLNKKDRREAKDDLNFWIMLQYRTIRKMQLFINYWGETREEFKHSKIDKPENDRRKNRHGINTIYHYSFGIRLCQELPEINSKRQSHKTPEFTKSIQALQENLEKIARSFERKEDDLSSPLLDGEYNEPKY